jgi:hypothetical protein
VNKNELKDVLCGASQVKHGTLIQAATRHLRRSQKTSSMAQESKHFKEEETERLCQWIEEQQLWYRTLDLTQFISSGAEQKVYLKGEKGVIKLNDSIYYSSWLDYFYNLLLNNYFFPDTAYQLLGFYREDKTLYAVVQQDFIKADTPTSIEEVRAFMKNNGFEVIRNNDYRNPELGIILEDLHDENVLTRGGVLAFIDTVFYLENDFWND